MRVGFVGLGNVGGKLAGSVVRNGHELVVHDLDRNAAESFISAGATWAESPADLTQSR